MFSSCIETRKDADNTICLETERYKKEIDSLRSVLDKNELQAHYNEEIEINNTTGDTLLFSKTPSKEILFRYIKNGLNLDKFNITAALWENYYSNSINLDHYWIGRTMLKEFRRESDFISAYFGNDEINTIIKLLKEDNTYFNAGIHIMVEGLLLAYDELHNQTDFLNKTKDARADEKAYHKLIETAYSPEVKKLTVLLTDDHEPCYNKLFIIYSFWARRHYENNAEIAYKILKQVHSRMVGNDGLSNELTATGILAYNKEKVTSQILQEGYSTENFDVETFNFLLMDIGANTETFEDFIEDNSIFIPRKPEPDGTCFSSYSYINRGIEPPDYMCKLNKIYSNFERTPDNINKVFNEKTLNHIASLYKNILPKDYRLYDVLKGLLMTYKELDDYDCEVLYDVISDDQFYYIRFEDHFPDIISDKVRSFVTKTSELRLDHDRRLFYLYSFWARRHTEGTKEAVYKILKKLDEKIID